MKYTRSNTVGSSILCILCCSSLLIQRVAPQASDSVFGSIDLTFEVSGKSFDVSFEPELVKSSAVAGKLCQENAAAIGVTQDTVGVCVSAVQSYIDAAVGDWVAEKTLQVPIDISGRRFDISFLPERESSTAVAQKLCAEHGATMGITAENISACIEPVAGYLQSAASRWLSSKVLALPLVVNGTEITVRFIPERHAPGNIASKLCTEQAGAIGLTQSSLPVCVDSVAAHLAAAAEKWMADKYLELPITVAEKEFTLRFMPERESAVRVAAKLCSEQAAAIGVTDENMQTACVEPVSDYVQTAVERWMDEKTMTTELTVNGLLFTVRLFPERPDAVSTSATQLCLDNAAALQLNTEELTQGCVQDVARYLASSVDAWFAERTFETEITLNDSPFQVSFLPAKDSARTVAGKLCSDQAASIGVSPENMEAACVLPVTAHLEAEVSSWRQAKAGRTQAA